jgi:hypothetical protein
MEYSQSASIQPYSRAGSPSDELTKVCCILDSEYQRSGNYKQRQGDGTTLSFVSIISRQPRRTSKESTAGAGVSLARRLLKPGLPTSLLDDGRRNPAIEQLPPIPNVIPPENEEFQIEDDATKKCASMGAQSFIEIGEDCIFSKRGCPDQRPLPFQSRQHSLPPTLKPTAAKSVHVHTQAPSGKRPYPPVVKSHWKALAAPYRSPSSRELPGLRMPLMTIDEFSEFNQGLHREPHFAPCPATVTDVPCWTSSADDSGATRTSMAKNGAV